MIGPRTRSLVFVQVAAIEAKSFQQPIRPIAETKTYAPAGTPASAQMSIRYLKKQIFVTL